MRTRRRRKAAPPRTPPRMGPRGARGNRTNAAPGAAPSPSEEEVGDGLAEGEGVCGWLARGEGVEEGKPATALSGVGEGERLWEATIEGGRLASGDSVGVLVLEEPEDVGEGEGVLGALPVEDGLEPSDGVGVPVLVEEGVGVGELEDEGEGERLRVGD